MLSLLVGDTWLDLKCNGPLFQDVQEVPAAVNRNNIKIYIYICVYIYVYTYIYMRW